MRLTNKPTEIIDKQTITEYLPWLTYSGESIWMSALLWGSEGMPIDEMLFWDWSAPWSISNALLLQKSSDLLSLFVDWPLGFGKHPRQPLLCYKAGLTTSLINTNY